ncbi:MAG: signal peptidase I [Alphaproteobacteria bacterium]|nr:signal peptidase I [Alphaproteobacteria bacterium]
MSADRDSDVLSYSDEDDAHGLGARFGLWVWDVVRTWGPALLAVLVIRSAIAEPFRIPSGSMVPTLEIGDHILVSKFAYGLRVPFTAIEVLPLGEPERGDIVVFKYPPNERLDYIKRIVGLPGDVVEVRDNTVFVNGQKAEKEFQDNFTFVDDSCRSEDARLFREDLTGVQHWILNSRSYGLRLADFGPYSVPEGEYFMMGDNRDNSADSRRWGTVPRDNIKGKAVLIWLSYDACHGNIPHFGEFRSERFFQGLE